MVLPGRNPVLLAKSIASLDRLSDGRVLPAFGLGTPQAGEFQAFGVERYDRAAWFDEALPLLRRLWAEDSVTHHGERFHLDDVRVRPRPIQDPIEVWLGGAAKSELGRCGRLGDGWMPSFCTPDIAAAGMVVVDEAAEKAGRAIDREHFGVLIPYVHGELPDRLKQIITARHADAPISDIVATNTKQLDDLIHRFIDVGFSKFIVFAVDEPNSWQDELQELASEILPLQT
jgi:probable F420-dependent oxidoreductase